MGQIALNVALIVFITVAVINRIKADVKPLPSWAYTVISVGLGAILYAIALYAPPVVVGFICVGGAASGIFDVYSKTGVTPPAVAVAVVTPSAGPVVATPTKVGPTTNVYTPHSNVVSKPK